MADPTHRRVQPPTPVSPTRDARALDTNRTPAADINSRIAALEFKCMSIASLKSEVDLMEAYCQMLSRKNAFLEEQIATLFRMVSQVTNSVNESKSDRQREDGNASSEQIAKLSKMMSQLSDCVEELKRESRDGPCERDAQNRTPAHVTHEDCELPREDVETATTPHGAEHPGIPLLSSHASADVRTKQGHDVEVSSSPPSQPEQQQSPGNDRADSNSPEKKRADSTSPGKDRADSNSPEMKRTVSTSPGKDRADSNSPGKDRADSNSPRKDHAYSSSVDDSAAESMDSEDDRSDAHDGSNVACDGSVANSAFGGSNSYNSDRDSDCDMQPTVRRRQTTALNSIVRIFARKGVDIRAAAEPTCDGGNGVVDAAEGRERHSADSPLTAAVGENTALHRRRMRRVPKRYVGTVGHAARDKVDGDDARDGDDGGDTSCPRDGMLMKRRREAVPHLNEMEGDEAVVKRRRTLVEQPRRLTSLLDRTSREAIGGDPVAYIRQLTSLSLKDSLQLRKECDSLPVAAFERLYPRRKNHTDPAPRVTHRVIGCDSVIARMTDAQCVKVSTGDRWSREYTVAYRDLLHWCSVVEKLIEQVEAACICAGVPRDVQTALIESDMDSVIVDASPQSQVRLTVRDLVSVVQHGMCIWLQNNIARRVCDELNARLAGAAERAGAERAHHVRAILDGDCLPAGNVDANPEHITLVHVQRRHRRYWAVLYRKGLATYVYAPFELIEKANFNDLEFVGAPIISHCKVEEELKRIRKNNDHDFFLCLAEMNRLCFGDEDDKHIPSNRPGLLQTLLASTMDTN